MVSSSQEFARVVTSKKTGEVLSKTIVLDLSSANATYKDLQLRWGSDFNHSIEYVDNPSHEDFEKLKHYFTETTKGLKDILNVIKEASPDFIQECERRNIITKNEHYETLLNIIEIKQIKLSKEQSETSIEQISMRVE